jgi:hypothetical protein
MMRNWSAKARERWAVQVSQEGAEVLRPLPFSRQQVQLTGERVQGAEQDALGVSAREGDVLGEAALGPACAQRREEE